MQFTDDIATPQILQDKDKPYVRFETEPREDKEESVKQGRIVYVDQDYAVITVPGGKSTNIEKIGSFFEKMKAEQRMGRIAPHWLTQWEQDYARYKQGQEIPLDGTPIRGWKLLRSSQQEELIRMNILTVEQLSNLTDEGLRNIGMGGIEMKRRAKAWLEQNTDKEAGAIRLAALEKEKDSLQAQVAALMTKLEALEAAGAKKDKK